MTPPLVSVSFLAAVVAIHDGDSLRVLTADRQEINIRVVGIDAPEVERITRARCVPAQPWSCEARAAAIALCLGRDVLVISHGLDRYGRTLAKVRCGRQDLGEALVRGGLAWCYPGRPLVAALDSLESEARRAKRGLWSERAPVAPWDWRRAQR